MGEMIVLSKKWYKDKVIELQDKLDEKQKLVHQWVDNHAKVHVKNISLQVENKLLKETQLTQSQREYLVKFLKLRILANPNQAIEEILEVLKEK